MAICGGCGTVPLPLEPIEAPIRPGKLLDNSLRSSPELDLMIAHKTGPHPATHPGAWKGIRFHLLGQRPFVSWDHYQAVLDGPGGGQSPGRNALGVANDDSRQISQTGSSDWTFLDDLCGQGVGCGGGFEPPTFGL